MPALLARLAVAAARAALAAAALATPLALYVVGRRLGDMRDREAPFWARLRAP